MTVTAFYNISRRSAAAEILSYPVISYMADVCSMADSLFCCSELEGIDSRMSTFDSLSGLKNTLNPSDKVLLFFAAAPTLKSETVQRLLDASSEGVALLHRGKNNIALCLPASMIGEDVLSIGAQVQVEIPDGEWMTADNAENLYVLQEQLRRRINMGWMKKGVFLTDPNTTHISPFATIGEGTVILPNCQIYGRTEIGADCRIGPNTMLTDAVIGDGSSVNASQVQGSRIGRSTTVGPFAYVRPDCCVGDNCRIGDFVELKNSNVGSGTKVSHLTYIGDSDFGEKINVGCGVVTVNYDGKNKYRTQVGDNSFVGCNVNLVAPVKVENGAYIAAGSTITDTVPAGALAIARQTQTCKPGWADKRRKDGKLK
ncbi:MAG: hypothetical protein J6V15_03500 [Clostridia bacterium]|nr:hypothetical protein [Clostridia bacterium]